MVEPSDQEIEAARKFFVGACDFVAGVPKLEMLPPATLPEVAFAGRSNVGKSSLLNALTGRNALARVSHTPGRTQQLNFFNLNQRLLLVDMPGYGYAKVSKQMKKEWEELIRDYLRGRPTLQCVYVLIDSRHGLKDADQDILKLLGESGVAARIVLTKCDKASAAEIKASGESIAEGIRKNPAIHPDLFQTSSESKAGIPELRAAVARFAD